MTADLTIFPLHTVLFPGGHLSLRIFEPRYLSMIGNCLKTDTPFGVCMIREGDEAGKAATPVETGTLAAISDWHKLPDELLGVECLASRRFRVMSLDVESNNLIHAGVELLKDEPEEDVPQHHQGLVSLARQILTKMGPDAPDERRLNDATWLGFRLAESLPFDLKFKQELLESSDPLQRLDAITDAIGRSVLTGEILQT